MGVSLKMTETLFSKSVILRDFDIHLNIHDIPVPKDMTITHRQSENNESYTILQGTKFHINKYLQIADYNGKLLSERYRKLSNLPKYRIYNSQMVRVQ